MFAAAWAAERVLTWEEVISLALEGPTTELHGQSSCMLCW
jgi:hypothetical protein